jgi:peptidoglycan hydrolase-like protein with peptidoglycan-binding domain
MPSKILSFNDFEKVYESENYLIAEEDVAAPPKDSAESSVIDPSSGEITEDPKEILDLMKELGAGAPAEGAEAPKEEKAPNESLQEQATAAPVNTLKVAKMGETSDRVKEIQKTLGLEPSGKFDQATKDAVVAFQKEQKKKDPKTVVDGIVGPQTYGLLLKIKKGITDAAEIAKQLDAFKNSGKMVIDVKKAGSNIALDPRYYDLFESIEVVTVNGTTYVVATPKADAAQKVADLKAAGLIKAGFEWLLSIPMFVGKALVYTAIGAVVVTVEVAKAMVNGAISVASWAGKKIMASSVVHGLGQLCKWIGSTSSAAWAKVKSGAAEVKALWNGFVTNTLAMVAKKKEAILAFAAACSKSLSSTAKDLRMAVHQKMIAAGKDLQLAWDKTKNLGEMVKAGFASIPDKAKEIAATIQKSYDDAVTRTNAIGAAVGNGLKSAGKSVVKVIGDGVQFAGQKIKDAGAWISSLAEALETPDGVLMLEWLNY